MDSSGLAFLYSLRVRCAFSSWIGAIKEGNGFYPGNRSLKHTPISNNQSRPLHLLVLITRNSHWLLPSTLALTMCNNQCHPHRKLYAAAIPIVVRARRIWQAPNQYSNTYVLVDLPLIAPRVIFVPIVVNLRCSKKYLNSSTVYPL